MNDFVEAPAVRMYRLRRSVGQKYRVLLLNSSSSKNRISTGRYDYTEHETSKLRGIQMQQRSGMKETSIICTKCSSFTVHHQ